MSTNSHYRKQEDRRERVVCPKCGNLANETKTQYGIRSQCCGLWSWNRHPLVDAETHSARKKAHREFDRLWKFGPLSRAEAYRRVSDYMGFQVHMKHLNAVDARRVVAWAKEEVER